MSIQLISSDHGEMLQDIFKNVNNELRIVSPFIGLSIVNQLCIMLDNNPQVRCEVITRFSREDFINGASNLDAINNLLHRGVSIYALRGLHTKLYLIDNTSAMMGSANFTSGGFYLNHELSLFISNEVDILDEMQNYYTNLMNAIKNSGEFAITKELVSLEIPIVEKSRISRKHANVYCYNGTQFGAVINKEKENDTGGTVDTIQSIIEKSTITVVKEGIWLKFEGDAKEREDPNKKYWLQTTDEYPHGITCFPTKNQPSGMKNNDYIYIAVVSKDKNGNNTPVIIGRGRTYGFEKGNVADKKMLKLYPWMDHFSVFVRLYDVEYLDTEQKNGISLLDVLAYVGTDTYPSTIGTMKTLLELRKSHYQKSHMRITSHAKTYIDSRFNEKIRKYGVCKV